MKTNQYLLTAILMALPLVSCGNSSKTLYEQNSVVTVAGVDSRAGNKRITKDLNLKNFHGFNIKGFVDVEYTEGSEYKVTVSGLARWVKNYDIKVSNGLLEVGHLHGNNGGNDNGGKIYLTVTAPRIDFIENSGVCTFTAQSVSIADDMTIKNSGSLKFERGRLSCNVCHMSNSGIMRFDSDLSVNRVIISNSGSLNVDSHSMLSSENVKTDNSGILKLNVGNVECDVLEMSNSGSLNHEGHVAARQKISINNDGVYKSKADCDVSGVMTLLNSGSSNFSGSVKAREYKCKISGVNKDKLAVKADNMYLDINGSGQINMNFIGGNVDMKCNGVCNVNMNLDCRRIKAVNSGSAKVVLAGTADEFVLDDTGISNINTKGLNRL